MRKILLMSTITAALIFSGCQKTEDVVRKSKNYQEGNQINKEAIALEMVSFLQESEVQPAILKTLRANKIGVSLENLISGFDSPNARTKANANLRSIIKNSNESTHQIDDNLPVEVPEVWLFEPSSPYNVNKLLVSFAPTEGDERDWKTVKAYNLKKEVVFLDAHKIPEVPVIVIETKGYEALKIEVENMNRILKETGLQTKLMPEFQPGKASRTMEGLPTTILDNIVLKNDQEPWILGAAELYAVTSGIRNEENEPEIAVIPMYYLDNEGDSYHPNQIMLFWDNYAYAAANIQLFEKDDNHNYKELTSSIVNGVISITGTLSGEAWMGALGQVASAIVNAMPDSWFTNDDDYVDSFYTIEKDRTYIDHYGAGRNAKISVRPYYVSEN